MANEIKVILPQTGESIEEAMVTTWYKKAGERVKKDEILYEISTDKVSAEIAAPATGTLSQVLAQEGDLVKVNSVIGIITADEQENGEEIPASSPPPPPPVAAAVAKGQTLAPSQEVPVSPPSAPSASLPSPPPPPSTPALSVTPLSATPLARRAAAEKNLNLAEITGSGLNNIITKEDVATHGFPLQEARHTPVAVQARENDGIKRTPMSPMRKKIAEHMIQSTHTSAHATCIIEADMERLIAARSAMGRKFEETYGFKLTYMPFFLQAAAQGIKAVPVLNSSVEENTIIYKNAIDISVAVALEWGLVVPVVRHVEEKNVFGVATALNDLVIRARNKKLGQEDLEGGSFSITNFGSFDILLGTPIINQPQVAIMGIGKFTKKPVVINDAIAIRTMAYIVLSFDHRIIDGKDAGKFLSTVKNYLENEVTSSQ